MRMFLAVCFGALAGLGLAIGIAFGDVIIHLKNGTQIRVPANNDDITSVEFVSSGASSNAANAKKEPAKKLTMDDLPQHTDNRKRSASYQQKPLTPREVAKAEGGAQRGGLPAGSTFIEGSLSPDGGQGAASQRRVVTIGPGRDYERPSELGGQIRPGDIIEIEPGLYLNDFVAWRTDDITIRGVIKDGKRPHFRATVPPSNRKAIWIVNGNNVVIENIEFSGAKVRDKNGAGIRYERGSLTIRNVYFHHNENGILTHSDPETTLVIENSEFSYRTFENAYAHGIYAGSIKKLVIRNSYFHHNDNGHHIKTRAVENQILYNFVADYGDGGSSYLIDFSNCGKSHVVGNVLQQGRYTTNSNLIAYGPEGCAGRPKGLYLAHNTMVNERGSGTFVMNRSMTPAVLENNLIVGKGKLVDGPGVNRNNVIVPAERFANRKAYDFRLAAGAAAIDKAKPASSEGGRDLTPYFEYAYPGALKERAPVGPPDAGAFEFGG